MMQNSEVVQALSLHTSRLRACLQRVSGSSSGPEEGSDAWLLLNALVDEVDQHKDGETLQTCLEQSGKWLAEHGGKLDTRLNALQSYTSALAQEIRDIFKDQPTQLADVMERVYQLQDTGFIALTRGYQSAVDSLANERVQYAERLERRLSALRRINGYSNSVMDLDQALEVTAQAVAEELQVELCTVFSYDELQRVLTLRATNGPHPLGGMHFTLRLGEGYSGWVADKGHPILLHDAMSNPQFVHEINAYNEPYHGLMSLPIIFFGGAERLIGVINVQSREPRDFTREEISFVEVIAGIIAINIENGRLYEQTDEQLRRKVHELATIHRVSSIIASTLNLDEVLQIITTQAVHLSNAERSCIFELDPETQQLHALAHYGLNSTLANRMSLALGQCCAGRTVKTGRYSMEVDCVHADENCILRSDPFVSADIHSVLCVPLQVKQKILGCICIYSSHRHFLSPEQMQLVITFANEAAIAIDNARLYEEARRGLELKSALLRELHHRVKNNLANVAGILSLQRRRSKSPEVIATLAESVSRVQGLAATHDLLAHEEVSEARLDDIARKIVGVANANLRPPDKHIVFHVDPSPTVIPSQAVTILALALNEMVSNAIKHGMADQTEGAITIRGWEEQGTVIVQVIDTGSGPQFSLTEANAHSDEGLGLSLITHMIGDLNGQFSLQRESRTEAGDELDTEKEYTVAEVRFPLKRRSRVNSV
jgi:GAF domain-containing protein